MHDLLMAIWANILPILIGAAITAVPAAFAAIKATNWWPKLGPVGPMIESAAMAAVRNLNTFVVNPAKANPALEGVGVLPKDIAAAAKSHAITETAVAVAKQLNLPVGVALEKFGPLIDKAIEAAVEACKAPDLPQASADLFPDKKTLAGLLVLFALAVALGGCASVPKGWADSNADQLKGISVALTKNVYGPEASSAQPVPALATAGRAGASLYNSQLGTTDKQARILNGCREELRSAKTAGIGVVNWDTLAATIRGVSGEIGNDADQCLGLLLAALCAPAKTSRLMLRYDQPDALLTLCTWTPPTPVLRP